MFAAMMGMTGLPTPNPLFNGGLISGFRVPSNFPVPSSYTDSGIPIAGPSNIPSNHVYGSSFPSSHSAQPRTGLFDSFLAPCAAFGSAEARNTLRGTDGSSFLNREEPARPRSDSVGLSARLPESVGKPILGADPFGSSRAFRQYSNVTPSEFNVSLVTFK